MIMVRMQEEWEKHYVAAADVCNDDYDAEEVDDDDDTEDDDESDDDDDKNITDNDSCNYFKNNTSTPILNCRWMDREMRTACLRMYAAPS